MPAGRATLLDETRSHRVTSHLPAACPVVNPPPSPRPHSFPATSRLHIHGSVCVGTARAVGITGNAKGTPSRVLNSYVYATRERAVCAAGSQPPCKAVPSGRPRHARETWLFVGLHRLFYAVGLCAVGQGRLSWWCLASSARRAERLLPLTPRCADRRYCRSRHLHDGHRRRCQQGRAGACPQRASSCVLRPARSRSSRPTPNFAKARTPCALPAPLLEPTPRRRRRVLVHDESHPHPAGALLRAVCAPCLSRHRQHCPLARSHGRMCASSCWVG